MVNASVILVAGVPLQTVGASTHGAALVGQGEEHNPVLPETEGIDAVLSVAFVAIPVFIVAFVVRQLVLTRRAAERAANAAERAASAGRVADEDGERHESS